MTDENKVAEGEATPSTEENETSTEATESPASTEGNPAKPQPEE